MSDEPRRDWYPRQEAGQRQRPSQYEPQYGQQSYSPGQPQYDRQDWGPYQDQPYPPYGQQPPAPTFTPNPQYGAPPGQPPYQGRQPYQGQPYRRPGEQPYTGSGPGRSPRRRKRHRALRGITVIAAVVVGIIVAVAIATTGNGNHAVTTGQAASTPESSASKAATSNESGFPPKTLAAFRAFAATGDASQVHQVASASDGLPSCPEPSIDVIVSPALSARALEADLSAFFVQSGLLSSQCQAFVFAYHSVADYEVNQNNGYTAGRVALTNTGSGSQRNLEVDTGSVVSVTEQTEFDFNF